MNDLDAIGTRMRDFIEMAVLLEIAEISRSGLQITDWHIEDAQRRMEATRTRGTGEELMFRLHDTKRSMRDLIEALAILACAVPGGVDFAGLRFCAKQSRPMACVERIDLICGSNCAFS